MKKIWSIAMLTLFSMQLPLIQSQETEEKKASQETEKSESKDKPQKRERPEKKEKGNAKSTEKKSSVTEEEKEKFKQALLTGDASYFQSISKPEYIAIDTSSPCVSLVQDVGYSNDDKLPQCFKALIGGLKNREASPTVCRTLLYLSPDCLYKEENKSLFAELREEIKKIVDNPNPKQDKTALAELEARYNVTKSPTTTETKSACDTAEDILKNRNLMQVSRSGERRSTAYTMSNLFFRHNDALFFTWMDKPLINAIGMFTPGMSRPTVECAIAKPTDDHGNATLVKDLKGRIHAIVGSHHGPFLHRIAEDPNKPYLWRDIGELADKATHPNLVCDKKGVLHLTYRSSVENPWLLVYQRFENEKWSEARSLVRAGMPWYYTWTNSLSVGPDDSLHLTFAACKGGGTGKKDVSDPYWGAAHIYSEDGGNTWHEDGGKTLKTPVSCTELPSIEDKSETAKRTMSAADYAATKGTALQKAAVTLQMLLSNSLVDEKGRPWVIVHNTLEKTANLHCAEKGKWSITADLAKEVEKALPGFVISEQSALSRHANGLLEAVLMVLPTEGRPPRSFIGWQDNRLELLRIIFDSEGKILGSKLVMPIDPKQATWQPNLEKWDWNYPSKHPALIFSHGTSESSYYENADQKNKVKREILMETWLDVVKN